LGGSVVSNQNRSSVAGITPQVVRPSSALSVAGLNTVAPEPAAIQNDQTAAADSAIVLAYEKRAVDEEVHDYSIGSSLSFFIKHSYRDIGRRKCHFCLSFCSVFIVVWSALVINTLVERGPIVFLKLAESLQGQYDGIVYPVLPD